MKNEWFFYLGILVLIISLSGCATLADRRKWETIPVKKIGWPEGIESWTYKRCCGQEWVWTNFGNDTDGVTPYFEGRQWEFWEWWLRNRRSNWGKYKIGYMWWEEGNPYAGWKTDHLDYRRIINRKRFFFSIIKPKNRSWIYWRPFFGINPIGKLCAWWGWQDRGMYCSAVRITDDPPWR